MKIELFKEYELSDEVVAALLDFEIPHNFAVDLMARTPKNPSVGYVTPHRMFRKTSALHRDLKNVVKNLPREEGRVWYVHVG